MPYLLIQTNLSLDRSSAAALGRKASAWAAENLGKSERYVLTQVQSEQTMSFAGDDAPCAYLQLKSLGLGDEQTPELSRGLCDLVQQETGIDPGRIYIEFASPPRAFWGWNGATF